MTFSDYNAFRVAFMTLLDGEQRGQPTFELSTADLMIGLGEARVYNGDPITAGLRASTMVEPLSQAVTANAAALPADLLELKEIYFAGQPPLEVVPLDRLRRLVDASPGGTPAYAAQDGDNLVFWPEASGTVIGSYYARPDDLKTVTWAEATTFARYPELYLYACLYEGALFMGFYERAAAFERRYREVASGANHSERMRAYGGSPLRVRTR